MSKYKVLFISTFILISTACSPPQPSSPITLSPSSTLAATAGKTNTSTATLPRLTDTPETSITPSPEVVEQRVEMTYHASITPSPEVVEQRVEMTYHVVQAGETTRDIAKHYRLSESSIIYSNFEIRPQVLAPGMTLIIPPIDGFYYLMKNDDTLPEVAHRFGVSIISILSWPENGLDQEIEVVESGKFLFIPGGKNSHFDWSTAILPGEPGTPAP
jgi:LysM repeat protein